ncbi:MAG: D-tyrosyl-tRNA(Tyr) deacylase [Clostridia bacterium]|nr:D-tyrosyl-tRNA(Tyr) deacylase [Clostridia bacterium]
MRAVVQRVSRAEVLSEGVKTGAIGQGLMVLLGVETGDTEKDAAYMAQKIARLRIFEDDQGKMNLNCSAVNGQVLCVSQFTLLGDARGQNRPGFTRAEQPERANELYLKTCELIRGEGLTVETGMFRTHMEVSLVNDGPVTLLIDSRKTF